MSFTRKHVANGPLLQNLSTSCGREHVALADFLADVAEVDLRRLYLGQGFPSMFAYCVARLFLSEDAAYKRIAVARAAREFPEIFPALADRRLSMTVVLMLAPHLNLETASELLAMAVHKTKAQTGELLARRFPKADVPTRIRALPNPSTLLEPQTVTSAPLQLAPERVVTPAPPPIARPAKVAPIAPQRFALQVTIGKSTREKLCYAQELLGHAVPSGDVAEVLDRALDALITKLEKQKFAASKKPHSNGRPSSVNGRRIPAPVRHAVWKRDDGQCTFVSASGQRCEARKRLEYEHVEPFARGGRASVRNVRLLCRAHNQFQAERVYGTEFMSNKRELSRTAQAKST